MSNNQQMKNARWKMTNDPVATARGSDTMAIYPSEVQAQPQTNLARAHRARGHEEGIEEGLARGL